VCRIIAVVVLISFLQACASFSEIKSLPTSEADFRLPPSEFVDKFGEIKAYQPEYRRQGGFNFLRYQQMHEAWGNADNVMVDSELEYVQLGHVVGFVGALSAFSPGAIAGVGGLQYFVKPPTPEVHTWSKGDYRVQAEVREVEKQTAITHWHWDMKAGDGYVPLYPKQKDTFNLMFELGASRGIHDLDDEYNVSKPVGGTGIQLGLGIQFENIFENTAIQVFYSRRSTKVSSTANDNRKLRITETPLHVFALYDFKNRWRAGGGISYYNHTRLDYSYRADEDLGAAIGLTAKVEFKRRMGARLEWVEQGRDEGDALNSSNIAFYVTSLFL